MIRQLAVLFCLLSVFLLPATLVRAQNLVVNGGFETGNFSGWSTNTVNTSGQVAGAAIHSGSFGAQFSESVFMGDITGEDQMFQTLPTQTGSNYILSFWANGVRQSSLGATWNGVNLLTNSIYFFPAFSALSPGWTNFQFVVQATGSSTLLTLSPKASPGMNGSTSLIYLDDICVLPLASYNQIKPQPLGGGKVKLTFIGLPGVNYAVDRTFSLLPAQWLPLSTNLMNISGTLLVTNTAVSNTNNFWRFRVVQ